MPSGAGSAARDADGYTLTAELRLAAETADAVGDQPWADLMRRAARFINIELLGNRCGTCFGSGIEPIIGVGGEWVFEPCPSCGSEDPDHSPAPVAP